jgi:hypothetical protein
MMSIESIKARLEAGYVMPEPNALKAVDAQQRERDLRALLRVAEAAKVIDDAMPAAYGIMKMWVVVEYMEDLRAALTELEVQE